MRKGEKLIKYLSEKLPVLDKIDVPFRDSRICVVIMNMTDEEFNRIVYDVENNDNWVEGFEIGKGT